MNKQKLLVAALIAGGFASPMAHATNGMNMEGYGPIAAAMGGASMAYDNGTAAIMNNPATLGLMSEGSRVDGALGLLAPSVTSKMTGMPNADSSATAFYMPAVGYATKSGALTYGAGVFAQGGMGAEYAANSFMSAGSNEKTRSEVGVGRFSIPVAYDVSNELTVGGSVDYVWATMDIKMALGGSQFSDMVSGLGGSQTYGSASGSMVNTLVGAFTVPQVPCGGVACLSSMSWARVDFSDDNPFDGAAKGDGTAMKLGVTYKMSRTLTLGATYHSKTELGDLKAGSASMSMNVTGPATMGAPTSINVTGKVSVHNFQWPETYGFGMAWQADDRTMIVADYKRIGWKDVMKNFKLTFTADATQADPMASGFGLGGLVTDMTLNQNWDDQDVFELGTAYKTTDALTLRAGVNIANNPVPNKLMNPLFPAVATSHATFGAGYVISKASEVNFSYTFVPKITAGDTSGVTTDFAGYSTQIMYSYKY